MYKTILKYHSLIWFLIYGMVSAQTPSINQRSEKEIRNIISDNDKTSLYDKATLEKKLIRYYQGLHIIDQVHDSIKVTFYKSYTSILSKNNLFKEANKNAKKAIPLIRKVYPENFELEKDVYADLASNYINLQNYDSTTWAYKKMIDIDLKHPKKLSPLISMNNLGFHYYNHKKYDSALYYFSKKIDYEDILHLQGNFNWSLNDNIALVYRAQNRLSEAKKLFIENYNFYANQQLVDGRKERRYRAGLQWADIEIRQGNFVKAQELITDIEKSLHKEINYTKYTESLLLFLKTKRSFAKAKKNFQEANQLAESYHHLKDSLTAVEVNQQQNDLSLLRDAALQNASQMLLKEQIISRIETENLQQKSTRIYGLLIIGFLMTLLVSGYILYKRKQQFSKKAQELQTQYAHSLIQNQEKERIRVAQELHNSVGQKLVLLSKKTTLSEDQEAQDLAKNTLEELRSISRSLHPITLENLGLTKALESLIDDMDAKSTIFFTHQIATIDHLFDQKATLHIYRIIQELLDNLVKHSNAKAASIHITHKYNTVRAIISDNGKGFDVTAQQKNVGLSTLRERTKILDAHIDFDSDTNKGTVISLNIPITI
ncbi:hypothetical protein GCM10011344_00260 [Dokdonia pacifica]|uniref:histidine kinase n=1 Tax=Dokdonia pacifica TaxID=1627892 RepID=A0A239D336_9FLAO|nr:ATP-binding protein [Dokdonia pacifica]GGG03868.1 hypothetical protein GCM10011344_00260 [Dokdonia pacifica]SNS26629.1 Histidine kinase [Dokdonia pacifica]